MHKRKRQGRRSFLHEPPIRINKPEVLHFDSTNHSLCKNERERETDRQKKKNKNMGKGTLNRSWFGPSGKVCFWIIRLPAKVYNELLGCSHCTSPGKRNIPGHIRQNIHQRHIRVCIRIKESRFHLRRITRSLCDIYDKPIAYLLISICSISQIPI